MISEGLDDCIRNIRPVEFKLPNDDRIKLELVSCQIAKPTIPPSNVQVLDRRIYPAECRQRHGTYKGMVTATMRWEINGIGRPEITRDIGEIPIMLRSSLCHLENLAPRDLVNKGEHENEWGGYFVVKGQEKLIRMLLQTRRNFPIALKRNSWKDRGHNFSNVGIMIRCVKTDQTSMNNVLHFLTNGQAKLMVGFRKRMFYIPVMMVLKALTPETDCEIYKKLVDVCEDDQYYVK
jgi:DNA-directed RNA polymerase I subunit RPA2